MKGVLAVALLAALVASVSADGLLLYPQPWEAKPTPRACMLVGTPMVTTIPSGNTIELRWNQTYWWGPENVTVAFSPDGDANNATWTLVWEVPVVPGENRIYFWSPTGITCPSRGVSGVPGCTLVAYSSRGFRSCAQVDFAPASPMPYWNPPTGWSPDPWWNAPSSYTPQPWWNSPSTNTPNSYTPQPWWNSPSTNTPSSYTPQPWWNSPSTNTPQPWWNSPSSTPPPQPYWNSPSSYYVPTGWQPPSPYEPSQAGICRPFPELKLDLTPVQYIWNYARTVNDSRNLYPWTLDPCARSSPALLINNYPSPKIGGPVAFSNDTAYFGGSHGQALIRLMNFEMPYCMQVLHRPALLNFWLRCGDLDFNVDSIDATHYSEKCEVSVYVTSSYSCAVSGHAASKPAKDAETVAESSSKPIRPLKPVPKPIKAKANKSF